jgi:hypothetical protein
MTLAAGAWAELAGAQGAAPSKAPAAEPGIYVEMDQTASPALVKLETSTMSRSGTKDLGKTMATTMLTGGMLGGKPKMALYFPGAKASLRVPAQAYFRFYFNPKAATARNPAQPMNSADMLAAAMQQMDQGDSGLPYGTKHPQEFALVRLEAKNDERQMVVSMEMKAKDPLPVRIRTVPDGYRVFTDHPLEPGEYGFFTMPKSDGTGGGGDKLWEFGVDPR